MVITFCRSCIGRYCSDRVGLQVVLQNGLELLGLFLVLRLQCFNEFVSEEVDFPVLGTLQKFELGGLFLINVSSGVSPLLKHCVTTVEALCNVK